MLGLWDSVGPPPPVVIDPPFLPSGSDVADMKLLWFFTNYTCSSFSVEGGAVRPVENVLRNDVVRMSLQAPFLRHTLLALAGLHQQTLHVDFDLCRALQHRANAFHDFRMAFESPRADMSDMFPAMLINSLLLTALTSQSFREWDSQDLYIINWMIIWRGIRIILDRIDKPTLANSGLQALFYRPLVDLKQAVVEIPANLLRMLHEIEVGEDDYPDAKIYFKTLKYLGSLYHHLRHRGFGAIMRLRIITWFTFLPGRFIDLARDKRPRALVIVAHYAAFLKLMGEVWWLKRVGDRALYDLCRFIDPKFFNLLQMPRAAQAMTDELSVARVILNDAEWVSRVPAGHHWDEQQESETRRLTWVNNEGREATLKEEGAVEDLEPVTTVPYPDV
ncbi:fungal specific transcription factor [Hirsutella rhossiliensis]|uniref:Fungal specific transcription factor domain-containing protein n=1 Tax=Hirsutella rhossiliensis TaxID=111463 RepID=A0A9P8SPK8_9HYPO|nr:fungal specific transcription factor domain-containing protein [Hirsutella rhossiliensis]KAH0968316.1 fungal specific transcription factor domain-containing protein [Hirsutella rhossiliensis]